MSMQCPVCSLENPPSAERCDCGHSFASGAQPNSNGTQPGSAIVGCLVIGLIAGGIAIAVKASQDTGEWAQLNAARARYQESVRNTPPIPTTPPPPPLELVSSSWHLEYGHAIYEGLVTNLSTEPLRNVTAVVVFKDANGGFITSANALIDYNPVLPGQSSPFTVYATENPAMKTASVDFKELMGGTIPFRVAQSKKGKRK